MQYTHQPVLLEEVLKGLNIQPDGVYVDGTFGRGGHAAVYMAGVPYVGTLTFPVSVNGPFRMAREVVPIASPSMLIQELILGPR